MRHPYWTDDVLAALDGEDDEQQDFFADTDGVMAQFNDVEVVHEGDFDDGDLVTLAAADTPQEEENR